MPSSRLEKHFPSNWILDFQTLFNIQKYMQEVYKVDVFPIVIFSQEDSLLIKSECWLVMTTDTQQSESMIYLFTYLIVFRLGLWFFIFWSLHLWRTDRLLFISLGKQEKK